MKKYNLLFACAVLFLSLTVVHTRAQAQGSNDVAPGEMQALAFAYDEAAFGETETVMVAFDPMAGALTEAGGLAAPAEEGNPIPWFLIGTGLILLVSAGVLIARYQ